MLFFNEEKLKETMSKLKETSYTRLSKCLFSDFFLHPDYIFYFTGHLIMY